MRVTRVGDAERFDSSGHHGVVPMRLQGDQSSPTDGFTVVLSNYESGGAADTAAQPAETVYVMVSGELTFESGDDIVRLGPLDSVHFPAGAARSVRNETDEPASMIVIRSKR